MTQRPTCATCWHFEKVYGTCHRLPPHPGGFDSYGTPKRAVWPHVSEFDYCAEHFEPATEEQPG